MKRTIYRQIEQLFRSFKADREENLRLAIEALKSPNPDAALELLAIMEEISSYCFYASWIMGNGYNEGINS